MTITEAPPMVIFELWIMSRHHTVFLSLNMVRAQHLINSGVERTFYKNWCKSKKKKECETEHGKKNIGRAV